MSKASSRIAIVVSTPQAKTVTTRINYVVTNAGWQPQYDVRVAEIDQPLKLQYRAKVQQHTGVDWENVRLNLSTGNPFVSSIKPELATYYLSFNNYYKTTSKTTSTKNATRHHIR